MATKTRKSTAMPEPTLQMADIDEALRHTALVKHRNEHWHRWANHLLDQRNRIARSGPQRETRVLYPTEYRDGE